MNTQEIKSFSTLSVHYFPEQALLFWKIKDTGMPNFCLRGLEDFNRMANWIKSYFTQPDRPLKYIVSGSNYKGIYNMGGDLPYFIKQIKKGNYKALKRYAHLCIDAIYTIHTNFDLPVLSIALVEGTAYGGGFECAMAHDFILASESAKFSLPENKFNMFPGMGAYSFLIRNLNPEEAEAILKGNKIYTASELEQKRIVKSVYQHDDGNKALYDFITELNDGYNFNYFHTHCKKQVNHVTKEELLKITNLWVEASKTLTHFDLRKMEAFGKAQARKMGLTPIEI